MTKHKFTEGQIAELKSALEAATNERVRRRLKALLLCSEGMTVTKAAGETNYAIPSVSRFIHEYLENGLVNITQSRKNKQKRPYAAPRYKFTDEQKAEIEGMRGTVADERAARKLEALWLRTQKKNLPDTSAMTGLHVQVIMKLVRKYHEQGLEAAVWNQGKHAKVYITYEEESLILEQLCVEIKQGHPIRTIEVKEALEKSLGRSVCNNWITEMLKRHHWQSVSAWKPPEGE